MIPKLFGPGFALVLLVLGILFALVGWKKDQENTHYPWGFYLFLFGSILCFFGFSSVLAHIFFGLF